MVAERGGGRRNESFYESQDREGAVCMGRAALRSAFDDSGGQEGPVLDIRAFCLSCV